eukprot:8795955-Pyramimonas_sp.AAC.2
MSPSTHHLGSALILISPHFGLSLRVKNPLVQITNGCPSTRSLSAFACASSSSSPPPASSASSAAPPAASA